MSMTKELNDDLGCHHGDESLRNREPGKRKKVQVYKAVWTKTDKKNQHKLQQCFQEGDPPPPPENTHTKKDNKAKTKKSTPNLFPAPPTLTPLQINGL